tara:strand:- start:117102 stop:117569 length:468 start_codon:yes stop_codon:yes gene_type:complete
MKSYEEFVEAASTAQVQFRVDVDGQAAPAVDALFHLPILALSLLVVVSAKARAVHTAELSSWTGALLSQHFGGLRVAARKLEWSVTLRARCADALVFLEEAEFVDVVGERRRIEATQKGKDFIQKAKRDTGEVGILIRALIHAEIRIRITGRMLF